MMREKLSSKFINVIVCLKVCLVFISFISNELLCSFTIRNDTKEPRDIAVACFWPEFDIVDEKIVNPGEEMHVSLKKYCGYLIVRALALNNRYKLNLDNRDKDNIRYVLTHLNNNFKIVVVLRDLVITDEEIAPESYTKKIRGFYDGSLLQTLPDYNLELKRAKDIKPVEFGRFMSLK